MLNRYKTNKVSAILGINAGYDCGKPLNDARSILCDISARYQRIAEKNFLEYKKETGFECYVSAVISDVNCTVYREEWGCPKGGEATFSIECTRNPQFISDNELYEEMATKNILELKDELKQSTVLIEYHEIACSYVTAQNK